MREKSLTYAIARAKRNAYKYNAVENIMDAAITYYLRKEDEIPELVKAYNKWARKHLLREVDCNVVLRYFE